MSLDPYLFFDGTCAEAFDFYRSVFGGEFQARSTYAEAPSDLEIPPEAADRMMHVSLPIGESVLMGSDYPPGDGERPGPAGFSISFAPADREEADAVFSGLMEGGAISMPLQETFWGSYFGQGTDRFGVQWMVNFPLGDA